MDIYYNPKWKAFEDVEGEELKKAISRVGVSCYMQWLLYKEKEVKNDRDKKHKSV